MKVGLRRNIDKHDQEKEFEKVGEVKLSKKIFKQLEAISSVLRTAIKVLNALYSDTFTARNAKNMDPKFFLNGLSLYTDFRILS